MRVCVDICSSRDRQAKAFDYYVGMGDERSLTRVAKKFNLSLQTIAIWSSRHHWVDRIKKRVVREIDKTTNMLDTIHDKQRRQTLALYSKTHERVINGLGAKPSVKDAIDLMRHELLLHGDARVMPGRDATASAPPVTLNLQVIIDALGVLPARTLDKFLDKLEAIDGDVVSPQPPDDNPSDAIVETK